MTADVWVAVSGDWAFDALAGRYIVGWVAKLDHRRWWQGWVAPVVAREVAASVVLVHNGIAAHDGCAPVLSWDGETLVCDHRDGSDPVRVEPEAGAYPLAALEWSWDLVSPDDVDALVAPNGFDDASLRTAEEAGADMEAAGGVAATLAGEIARAAVRRFGEVTGAAATPEDKPVLVAALEVAALDLDDVIAS